MRHHVARCTPPLSSPIIQACPRAAAARATATKSPGRRCEQSWLQGLLAQRYTACSTRPRIRMRHTTAPLSSPPLTAPLYTAYHAMQRAVQCCSTCFAAGATLQPAQVHHYPPMISPALQSVTWTCSRAASGCGAVMWQRGQRGQLGRSSHGAHLLLQQRHA
jgi:hypothetical protein